LQKLDEFDQRPISEANFDIKKQFGIFAAKESASHTPPRPISELVLPSGDPNTAALLLHLRYPSKTTKHLHNGEIADDTNCCMKLLLESGFNSSNAFWIDTFSRREKRASGGNRGADWVAEDAYTPKVYDLHLSWSNLLRKSAVAKVEIVFGAANRKLLEKEIEHRHECLTLWTTPPIKLHVEYQDRTIAKITRLIIFVHHPEHFFYNWKLKYSIEMDTALTVAAKLAGLNLECTFFQDRIQYYTSIRLSQNPELEESGTSYVPTHGRSAWKIITDMLALEEDGALFSYESLPPSVLEWTARVLESKSEMDIKAKYHDTFWEGGSKRDLKAIRDKWNDSDLPIQKKSRQRQTRGSMQSARDQIDTEDMISSENAGLIKMLDRLSRSTLGSRTAQSYATSKTYAYEEFLIRKPDLTMEVACEKCKRKSIDNVVRYWKTHPEYYVVHLTETCNTVGCTGFQRCLIPVDSSIPWVKGTTESLNVKKTMKGTKSSLDDYLSFSYGTLPESMTVHCKTCGGSQTVDEKPRWTGHDIQRYLCQIWTCSTCKKPRHFVPVDDTVYMYRGSADRDIKSGKMPQKREK